MKKSFVLYHDQYEPIKTLSLEDKGKLLDAIFEYNLTGEEIELEGMVRMAFMFFKGSFDRNNKEWKKRAERNKENGKKGGRPKKNKNDGLGNNPTEPKKPSGFIENPENPPEPKKAVSGSVSVPVSASVTEVEEEFNMFWEMYDKKADRDTCFSLWCKLKASEREEIFKTLPRYVASTPDKQFRKGPASYLRKKTWMDEIIFNGPDPTQEEGYMSPQQIHDNIKWDVIAKLKTGRE